MVIESKKSGLWWRLGLVATGLAGASVFLFRGCWHSKMSWPIRTQQHSYQVCTTCGIKRLFDEKAFRGYGPYSYELDRLIAWSDAHEQRALKPEPKPHRTAS
ncbi:MAG TPA: hypothetical protein VF753_00520 [Terriglobales bacterium]